MNKHSNSYKAGLLLLIVLGLMFAASLVMSFILNEESSLITQYILNALLVSIVSIALPSILFIGKRTSPEFNIRRITLRQGLLSVCIGIAAFFTASSVNTMFHELFSLTGANTDIVSTPIPDIDNAFSLIVGLIVLCIVPAITEELLFRGVLLYSWRSLGRKRSVMLVAMLFSLLHFSLPSLPALFAIGLMLGFAAFDSRSIIPGIIIHFTNNFISLVFSMLGTDSSASQGAAAYIVPIMAALFFVIGIILFFPANRAFKVACLKVEMNDKNDEASDTTKPMTDYCSETATFPRGPVITSIVIMSGMTILNALMMYIPMP